MRRLIAVLIVALALATGAEGASAVQDTQSLPVIDYRIGAKDLLEIAVFELPELNQTMRVSEDGSITMSLLGKVEVAGLTAQELEAKLASLLEERFTTGGAHVTVFIKEYQKVAVIGAVGRPGMYEMVGPTTLLQMIAQAGGLSAQHMGELFIYRQGDDGKQTKIVVRLDDLTVGGNQDLNIPLQPKDVVTVPIDQVQNVFVYGEVRNPGAISFMSSKGITLIQAIAQAGGTTEWAKESGVVIKRRDKRTGKEMKIPVKLKHMISGKLSDLVLMEGDVVIVP
ncbi:MAG: polysaccharide biosynthesis/export family protein [Candidatus Aminicenantes bacterium]